MSSDMRESAVEYLLGELPADQIDRFEAELLLDSGLRAEVERLRPVVARLESTPGEAWEPVEPPPLDIAAIVGADATHSVAPSTNPVSAEPAGLEATQESPAPSAQAKADKPRRSLAERLGLAWPTVAAAAFSALLILAVGIGVGTQLGGDGATSGDPAQTLALDTIGQEVPAGASGEVLLTGDAGDQLTLDVSGLEQTGDREFYEFWLLGDEGELVSLGSFRVEPDGNSQIDVPLPVNPEKYRYFDVSIEPENGSPDHSGRSVLRGLTPS